MGSARARRGDSHSEGFKTSSVSSRRNNKIMSLSKEWTVDYPEESLDPEDWDALRALGHRMVDDMLTYLQTVRERPVWQPIPEKVKERLKLPAPLEPQGAEAAYQDFVENVLPHPMGNIHPRFWSWVIGTGTP